MQKEINKLVSKNKARVKPAPRGKAPSHKLLSSILLHLKIEQITKRKKAENGGGNWASRCAGGRGNTTHTPEAGDV